MAIEIHSTPPLVHTAGDVYEWHTTPEDLNDVTSYKFTFRSVEDTDVAFSVSGNDQTTYYQFQLASGLTEHLPPGEYKVTEIITYTWGRESDEDGRMELLPNPEVDPEKSFNQRMVDLLKSHLEGRAPDGIESHTIGGVPINKIPLTEAQSLLVKYEGRLKQENGLKRKKENPEMGSGTSIKLYF